MKKIYLLVLGIMLGAASYGQYCTAGGPSFTTDTNVEGVALTGETTNIAYTGCPGVLGVEDQTIQVADLIAGNAYSLDVTWGSCGGFYGNDGEVWIDFDGSQSFEPGESIGTVSWGGGNGNLQTYPFVVPGLALNGTHRMRVMSQEGGTVPLDPCAAYNWGSVTDFSITISGGTSCGPATGLTASNVTGTTADLAWTPDGGSTGDNVEWGFPGFAPGTGAEEGSAAAVVGGAHTATGLMPTTTYEYYVQTDCGVGGMAGWAGPFTFTTPLASLICGSGNPFVLYSQDFEGGFPGDWSHPSTVDPDWTYNTGTTGSTATGPSAAHSGTGYVYLETSGGALGDNDTLIGPAVDLSSVVDAARLTFYYHMYGGDIGTLEVLTSTDNVSWTSQWTQTGQVQTVETDAWTPVEIDLTPYTGGFIYVRFVGSKGTGGSGFAGDMAIDLVQIEGCVNCPGPNTLVASNVTGTDLDLSWTETGTSTNWIIEYGPTGFTPGTGTTMVTTNNPENVSGLTQLTGYDFYVASICGPGDTSSYAGPLVLTTPLNPLNCTLGNATSLLLEDFEGGFPVDWTITPGTPNFQYTTGTTTSTATGPSGAHSNTGYIYLETSSGAAGSTDTLSVPSVDLTSTVADARATFYYHMYGATMGKFAFEVSTDGVLWTEIWSDSGEVQTDELDAWLAAEADLTPYTGNVVQMRFIGTRGTSFTGDMALDLFEVEACISCPNPTALNVSNETTTTVDLDWTNGGTETAWIIEYGPAGFTPGTGTQVPATGNPETVTGLIDNTNYDFYVYADCGSGDVSTPNGPVNTNTLIVCPAPTAFAFTYEGVDTVATTWTPGGLETAWNVEYGPLGYTPGTGTGHVATILPDSTFNIPTGIWEFYVQADCGGGLNNPWAGPLLYISPIQNDSTCDAIPVPVDGSTTTFANVNATEQVGSPVTGFNTVWFTFVAPATGHVQISTCGTDNNFNTMLEVYETTDCSDFLAYTYIDGATGNPFTTCDGVFSPAGINLCGLAPGNTYYLVIGAENALDEGVFPLTLTELPAVVAGVATPQNVCEDNAAFDMFTTIAGNLTTNGQWYNPVAAPGNEITSTVNIVGAPAGVYPFFYVDTEICGSDTVETAITVIELPNVGMGSTLNAGCNYGSVNLYDGLSGTVDLGGTWYDASSTDLGGGTADFSGEAAGSYDFYYVVDNGTCAADTATVVVDIIDCTNLDENAFNLDVYPNPVRDVLNIRVDNVDGNTTVQLISINGETITAPEVLVTNVATIEMSDIARGVYFLRVTNNGSTQEVRVVKQ